MKQHSLANRRTVLKGTAAAIASIGFVGPAIGKPDKGAEQSGKFQLDGTAEIAKETGVKPTNHVAMIDTRPSAVDPDNDLYGGSIGRHMGIGQLPDLEDKLTLDVKVAEGHTILSGPRILLSVDTDGDGEHDGWIYGFDLDMGPSASGPGVNPSDGWVDVSYTGDGTRWNDNAIGGSTFRSWDEVIADWSADYTVLEGWVVDDSYWVDDGSVIYLDNIQIGTNSFEGPTDAVGN